MTFREKALYHQIHPAKLAVDIFASFFSLYFFWQHHLITGIIIAYLPSLVISWYLMRFLDLSSFKESGLGKYIKKYMSLPVQCIRLLAFIVMAFGAWHHSIGLVIFGILCILPAWGYGLLLAEQKIER